MAWLWVPCPLAQSRRPSKPPGLGCSPAEALQGTGGVGHVPPDFPTPVPPSYSLFLCLLRCDCLCVRKPWCLQFLSSLEHHFLRAWSLDVPNSFILGISFLVLPRKCNQISYTYLCYQVHIIFWGCCLRFNVRHSCCICDMTDGRLSLHIVCCLSSLAPRPGSLGAAGGGGGQGLALSLGWKGTNSGQRVWKLTSRWEWVPALWLLYMLWFLATPSWFPVFVRILTGVQHYSKDFLCIFITKSYMKKVIPDLLIPRLGWGQVFCWEHHLCPTCLLFLKPYAYL